VEWNRDKSLENLIEISLCLVMPHKWATFAARGVLSAEDMRPKITKVWDRFLRAWERPRLGWLLIVVAVGLVLFWFFKPPPSGYAVIAMAVAAGLQSMRAKMRGGEKWLWAAIFTLFAFIEINAVNRDRDQQNDTFKKIGDGITKAIQQSAETMRGIDIVRLGIVQLALEGSCDKSPDERRQIRMETAEYLKNGQSSNLSNFSSRTLSVVATELAQNMEVAFHDWTTEVDFVGETFGHQMLYAKTTDEKQRVQDQQKVKMDAALRNSNSELASILSETYLVCKEMMARIPTTPDDRAFLARLQNFAQTVQGSDNATGLRSAVEDARYMRRLAKRLPP